MTLVANAIANARNAATAYAATDGFFVFPVHALNELGDCTCGDDCTSPAKHPRTRRGLHDASENEAQIARWWAQWPGSNVGIVTGKISGFFVLDIDGDEGYTSLESLIATNGELPPTRSAATGGGGRHMLFKYPPGAKIKNSTGKIGIGLDIRGDGGYIVAPPSIHASGNFYQWIEGVDHIADAPAWLLDLVNERPSNPTPPNPRPAAIPTPTVLGPGRYTRFVFRQVLSELANAQEGMRNESLNKAAFRLGQFVGAGLLARQEVAAMLRDQALALGLGERETDLTIRSGLSAGERDPAKIPEPKTGAKLVRPATPTPITVTTKPARDEVLIPGPHATPHGYAEIGNHIFADDVIGRFPVDTLYRRGAVGEVVGEPGKRQFRPCGNDEIRLSVDRSMRLAKYAIKKDTDERVQVFIPCTRDQAGIVVAAAASDPRVPLIESLTNYPVYLPRFELCRPGFFAGTYYDAPAELGNIVLETDPAAIREVLNDLVVDFPFKDEADRQNYFGLLLTPILAPAIAGNRPMHLIHSPLERTGKTKLADEGLGGTLLGRRTPAQQMADASEETDKRVLSMLLRGETLLHLDNLPGFLDSPAIASLLTAATYQGRLLGSNKIIDVPNTLTIVATGNNVRATGEIVKRTVSIRLQPGSDRPEDRSEFKHPDFFAYVLANRRRVIGCLLGAVDLWKSCGMPRGRVPLGGFDEWAAVVGGIMHVCGFDRWMGNVNEWRQAADARRGDLEALADRWHAVHGGGMTTAAELLEIANALELFPEVIGGKEGKSAVTAFGMRVLKKNIDMPVGEFIIRKSDLSRPSTYFLGSCE